MIVELRTTVFYRPTEKGETGYFNVGRTHMTMLDPSTGMNFLFAVNSGTWTCPRIVTITDGDVHDDLCPALTGYFNFFEFVLQPLG